MSNIGLIGMFGRFFCSTALILLFLLKPLHLSAAEEAQGLKYKSMTTYTGGLSEPPEIAPQLDHSAAISSIVFTPNGKMALTGSWDNTLKLWDIPTGREIKTVTGHSGRINSVAITPDGKYAVSGSSDKTVIMWDLQTCKEVRKFIGHTDGVNSVTVTSGGRHLISSGNDNAIRIWDINSGREIKNLQASLVSAIATTPDGRYILSVNLHGVLKLLELSSGREIREYKGHTAKIVSIAFTLDGRRFISGSSDKTVKLWDVERGTCIRTFAGHDDEVVAVALSPDGKSAFTGSKDKTVRFWDISSGRLIRTVKEEITAAAYSPDGRTIMSAGNDRSLKILDANSGTVKKILTGRTSWANTLALLPDGKSALVGNSEKRLVLWDLLTGRVIRAFPGHSSWITSLAVSSSGRHAITGSSDNSVKYWDIEKGKELRTYTGHSSDVRSVAISRDGRHAISGSSDKTIKVWDLVNGNELKTLAGHTNFVNAVAFSPDGKTVVSGSMDKSIKLWNIQNGVAVRTFAGHDNGVTAVAFSSDGKRIVSGGMDNVIKVWDVESGKEIKTFSGHSRWIFSVAFTPDMKHIISGSMDNSVRLWNYSEGKEVKVFRHAGWVFSALPGNDAKHIYSVSADGTLRTWDAVTAREIVKSISFTDGEWISITPDGYYNASPNADKHLNVRIGSKIYGIENYREAFYRPDLLKVALSGGSLKGYRNVADVRTPPLVEIIDAPLTVAGDEITLKLKFSDTGGGIGDVRLYLNGSAIMLDNSRGLKVVDKGISRSYKIRLARGDNIIRAVAFNAENTMQSNPAEQTVTATFTQTVKPTLHALVIGVNEFKNPKLRLQYAVADADLFTETLKKSASELFGKVNLIRLTTPEQTTSEYISRELKKMQTISPEDMFILFVASHGTVDDGEYFLITSNVGSTSTARLKTDALSQDKLKELIANIPATKKVIVLDTCNAGKMGDAIQTAMLTRGMSEDTAFKILSRAVGSTILSSATSTQEALEGYQGHGLFTWVLAEGMKGKADKGKTGYIKTTDLVDYVESEVPEIAEKHFKRKQYPTTGVSGQGFPIGKRAE